MGLQSLPSELLAEISAQLPNCDIQSWRLVCTQFSRVQLRIHRVFISANPKDIDVFRAIADHETYRNGIKEIIWDESRFDDNYSWVQGDQIPDTPPRSYESACDDNLWEFQRRRSSRCVDSLHYAEGKKQEEHLMTTDESWKLYCKFMMQQREVIAQNLDSEAFEYGLRRFTTLKRITFTPAAHGLTFMPLYQTPMMRTLPYGLNYKLPRGWPVSDNLWLMFPDQWDTEVNKEPWRGFREAIRHLAEEKGPSVTELVLDVNQLLTGLTCHFFDKPCKELNHLITVLKRPGFRRLDLSIMVGAPMYAGWGSFRNGWLRRALAEASSNLEHISLRTDVWESMNASGGRESDGYIDAFIPLHAIFPIENWPKLQYFGLSRFLVRQDDVVSFLSTLPKTIRTVELSFLFFLEGGGNYRDLLEEIRNTLDWQSRDIAQRPKVIIGLELCEGLTLGTAVWLEAELELFFYGNGKNPFQHDDERASPSEVLEGVSGTVRNAFQPGCERPFVDRATLIRSGFLS